MGYQTGERELLASNGGWPGMLLSPLYSAHHREGSAPARLRNPEWAKEPFITLLASSCSSPPETQDVGTGDILICNKK